ncbi:hypothetical protein [Bradyrhizobium sp. ORS 285]|uniref:hypothetical protein n=1 Tax=Bradyrhizobium sp. ORS 285 TaxID=115808 RepID=UPI00055312C5|nr:hypothetical protein [Bradyrhizobium sp. ORS 285]
MVAFTGGIWSSRGRITAPHAQLHVFPEALRLVFFDQDYVLPREAINALSKMGIRPVNGLRIRHSTPLYPSYLVFWPRGLFNNREYEKLRRSLDDNGYTVT